MVAIPGGEPLIHKEIGEIVEGHRRAQEVRLALHQCAAAGKEAASVRAVALSVLLGASRRPEGAPRQVGVQEGVFDRAVRRSRPPRPRASRQRQRHDLRRPSPPRTSRRSSTLRRRSASTSRSRPATPMSARPTRSTSSTARRPRSCSARSSRSARARAGSSCIPACSSTSSPATRNTHCTPWGMPTRNIFGWQKPCYLLGEGYAEDLQGADGDHRLGRLRHRPLREVRQLHGALRLRADRRQRSPSSIRSRR